MSTITIGATIHFGRSGRGAKKIIQEGVAPPKAPGRIPRVSRLMALAIRFDGLVRDGVVEDYAELAKLGRVTRADQPNHELVVLGPGASGGVVVSAAYRVRARAHRAS